MKTDSHLPQFADLMSEYVNFISGIGKCDYITRIYLNSFAKYCMNHGGVLSDDIISEWASRTDKESYYTNRNRCIILRRFIRYIRSKYGAPFKLPSYPPDIKYIPKPKRILVSEQPYSYSAISHIVKQYELYKKPLGNSVGGQWTRFAVSMTSAPELIRQPKLLRKKLSLIIARREKRNPQSHAITEL